MMGILALVAATGSASCSVPPAEIARQLELPYEQFDTGAEPKAWRQLNGAGCTDEAVRLLSDYAAANSTRLSAAQKSELAFHRGQALAFADRNADAIPHFEQALSLGGTREWTSYVAGNIAFLKRDVPALREARNRYAAVARGSMRLKFLDGFLACPNEPYMKAAYCAK